ncbi:hypothetical protein IAG25_35005 [Caballeronia sp. EK]|uniref:hypothetical protein n=1 Tax=Caballeronia sp. EK TaxID=2767469 RepID=UPI0016566C54|nr:hypothetical protein [Caballeronia sp. EK]MBC8642026.1 hypothetical protein [Caballeronia sp. EK]
MSDIIGLGTHLPPSLGLSSSPRAQIAETLQSVDFSDPASVQQARDSICDVLGNALGDHLFEHGAEQGALQQIATLALSSEAQRQGYGDVQGLTSQERRMAQVLLVSHLSQVGVDTFVPGNLNHGDGHEALEFRFDSGRKSIDTLITLNFPELNLGDKRKDLVGGGEQLVSSLVATALNEAVDLDPERLDWEIQAALTRLNSRASTSMRSHHLSSQEILLQTKLLPEAWWIVRNDLTHEVLGAVRCVNSALSTLDAPEVTRALELTKRAASVSSLEGLNTLLDDIQKLPPGYRREPLTAIASGVRNLLIPTWDVVFKFDGVLFPKDADARYLESTSRWIDAIEQLDKADKTQPYSAVKELCTWHLSNRRNWEQEAGWRQQHQL